MEDMRCQYSSIATSADRFLMEGVSVAEGSPAVMVLLRSALDRRLCDLAFRASVLGYKGNCHRFLHTVLGMFGKTPVTCLRVIGLVRPPCRTVVI